MLLSTFLSYKKDIKFTKLTSVILQFRVYLSLVRQLHIIQSQEKIVIRMIWTLFGIQGLVVNQMIISKLFIEHENKINMVMSPVNFLLIFVRLFGFDLTVFTAFQALMIGVSFLILILGLYLHQAIANFRMEELREIH